MADDPKDPIEKLDERIEQLQARRAVIIARKNNAERKRDTRRKVILGAGLVSLVRAGDADAAAMYQRIRTGLDERQATPFDGWVPATKETGGCDMSAGTSGDAPGATLAELDAEIERLTTERAEYQSRLADPAEKSHRRIRRQQILGVAVEGWTVPLELMKGVHSIAGDQSWLFEPDLMRADGWILDTEQWKFSTGET